MSKVLFLANDPSGLYDFRKELIAKIIEKGNEVLTSYPDTDSEYAEKIESLGCKIIDTNVDRRGINPIKDIKLIFEYIRIVSKEKPDYIITYTIKPNIYGAFVSRILHKKYFCNITGLGSAFQNDGILKRLVVLLYKFALKKVSTVFFENCENMQIFIDLGIVPENKCKLLNGAGVNLDDFPYIEYPVESNMTKFLFMGRVMAEKGVNELFDAMKRLFDEGYKFELDILGYYEEKYYEDIVNKYIEEGWLNFHGFVQDVKPFIKETNCSVLPSWHEGMANTNLECAASGRPIITTNIHGCLESVVENKSGYLVEKKNADSLYECLKSFIELSYSEKIEMGKQARIHMENTFDKSIVVNETVERMFNI